MSDPEPPLAARGRRGRFSPSAFRLPSGVAARRARFRGFTRLEAAPRPAPVGQGRPSEAAPPGHRSGPPRGTLRACRVPARGPCPRCSGRRQEPSSRAPPASPSWRRRGPGQPRTCTLPRPGARVDSARPLRGGADLTAPGRSGRIGPRWEGRYPRCDKAKSCDKEGSAHDHASSPARVSFRTFVTSRRLALCR